MALKPIAIRNAKPDTRAYKPADEGGLYLLIQPDGAQYRRFNTGLRARKSCSRSASFLTYRLPRLARIATTRNASYGTASTPWQSARRRSFTRSVQQLTRSRPSLRNGWRSNAGAGRQPRRAGFHISDALQLCGTRAKGPAGILREAPEGKATFSRNGYKGGVRQSRLALTKLLHSLEVDQLP